MNHLQNNNIDIKYCSERLNYRRCQKLYNDDKSKFILQILSILTSKVTQSLPKDWQQVTTSAQAELWLQNRFDECELLAIQLKSNWAVIGIMFIHTEVVKLNNQRVHIGYLIAEPYWRQGFASEALLAFIQYCQRHSGTTELIAGVDCENTSSIRVLEKCGFELDKARSQQNNLFYKFLC